MNPPNPTLHILLIGARPRGVLTAERLLTHHPLDLPAHTSLQLTSSPSLHDALPKLRASPPHLVLADLPPQHDLDALTHLLASTHAPVLIFTPQDDHLLAQHILDLGAHSTLPEARLDLPLLSHAIRRVALQPTHTDPSHDGFRHTIDLSDAATLILDPQGHVLHANPAALKRLGDKPTHTSSTPLSPRRHHLSFDDPTLPAVTAHLTDTLWNGRLAKRATLDPPQLQPTLTTPTPVSLFEGIASASPRLKALFQTCERVAPSPATILIQGETGTGKELIARAIHKRSQRTGRFVALDCGAVPESLLDSELFGHERGAFTGANSKKQGLFRHAHGGTLLLDEVGNMPPNSQHSLLRALQEGAVRPLGAMDEVAVDVRIIAATSTPLEHAVAQGHFRSDLLYRLDVIRLDLLPLRQRPEDIVHLLELFSHQLAQRYDLHPPQLGLSFLEAAVEFHWPGNVRQLENAVERIILTGASCHSRDDFLRIARSPHSPKSTPTPTPPPTPTIDTSQPLQTSLEHHERAYLQALLAETNGSVKRTAQRAQLDERTIRRKLKRHHIDRADFRS